MLQPLCTNGRNSPGPSWFRLPLAPEAASTARVFATGRIEGEDAEFVSDVELVTSELVTNALCYAAAQGEPAGGTAPGIWLGVVAAARYCHVRVRDPYPVPPRPVVPEETDESGRGLLIVALLSAAHWTDLRTCDKTVHAVVAKPGIELSPAELVHVRR
jgi:anti-sigma regulatory factor (Ser/Thr protein kinase)